MGVKLQSSSGGSVEINAPATASTFTLTAPARNGTLGMEGPAFSAYQSSGQAISTNTVTKVLFQTEEFDTGNCFADSRFTPNVAGYYQISANVGMSSQNWMEIQLYKNGSPYKVLSYSYSASVSSVGNSVLVYMNGTTDYVEIYLRIGAGQTLQTGTANYFTGVLVRAA